LLKHLIVQHLLGIDEILVIDHLLDIVLVALALNPVVVGRIIDRRTVIVAQAARVGGRRIGNDMIERARFE
jgi:hypothetical protein